MLRSWPLEAAKAETILQYWTHLVGSSLFERPWQFIAFLEDGFVCNQPTDQVYSVEKTSFDWSAFLMEK